MSQRDGLCENYGHARNMKKAGAVEPGKIADIWTLRGRCNFISGDPEVWCQVCRKVEKKNLARVDGKEMNTKERDRICRQRWAARP